ncbi:MAG: ester cyclase [Anaerolineales bacterium]|nr:ester cyclase [Anaerolineales bacterium]
MIGAISVVALCFGTPNGNFMGVQTDGTKSFKTMTIDIHTVENGQVVEVHHLEDWATTIKQLSAN